MEQEPFESCISMFIISWEIEGSPFKYSFQTYSFAGTLRLLNPTLPSSAKWPWNTYRNMGLGGVGLAKISFKQLPHCISFRTMIRLQLLEVHAFPFPATREFRWMIWKGEIRNHTFSTPENWKLKSKNGCLVQMIFLFEIGDFLRFQPFIFSRITKIYRRTSELWLDMKTWHVNDTCTTT